MKKVQLQILAITNKIKKGKVKNKDKAKGKIREINSRIELDKWLAQ